MERVLATVKLVQVAGVLAKAFKKLCLIRLALSHIHIAYILCQSPFLAEGQFSIHKLMHTLFKGCNLLFRQGHRLAMRAVQKLAVHAAGQGVIHNQSSGREKVPDRLLQQEGQATHVAATAVGIEIPQKLDTMGIVHPEGELLKLMVHISSQDRILFMRFWVLYLRAKLLCHIHQGAAGLNRKDAAGILTPNIDLISHTYKISFKNGPVTEAGLAANCSGVPWATILPPARPPSGPRSNI